LRYIQQNIMSFAQLDESSPMDPINRMTTMTTTTELPSCCPYALRKLQQQQRRHFGYSTFRINENSHNHNSHTHGHYDHEEEEDLDGKDSKQKHHMNDKTVASWPIWKSLRMPQ
jgi:hypothetical protein